MNRYYTDYAKGGFSLIMAEGTYTGDRFSQANPSQPGMITDKQAVGWRAVVEAVHNQGGKIILQLMHAGALSQHLEETRGPSEVQPLCNMLSAYSGR